MFWREISGNSLEESPETGKAISSSVYREPTVCQAPGIQRCISGSPASPVTMAFTGLGKTRPVASGLRLQSLAVAGAVAVAFF